MDPPWSYLEALVEEAATVAAATPSLLATWTMTLPVRIPLKMAMASECDSPDVEWPFTERISSPASGKGAGEVW